MMCVVSVVDSISATSMPINEFVIYRSTHKYPIKQGLIVCNKSVPQDVQIPKDIAVYLTGNDRTEIRKAVQKILNENKNDKVIFHMHHQKSALCFLAATVGMGIRRHTLYTVHSTFSARDTKYKISSCLCALLAENVNCVSCAAYEEYAIWVKMLKTQKFFAIPNGVDIDRIDKAIEENPSISNRNTLICVGRMIPLKNHEFLIYLLEKLPHYKLILVGAEDKEGKIRKLAKQLKVIDRVEITGLIPREEVFRKLNSASIYVSASYVEGLPVSVLEAMRVGLIPILSEINPHKEIANKCEEVITLPYKVEVWKNVIEYYGELDQEDFSRKSELIRAFVKEKFSLDKMHEEYMKIYKRIE